MLNAACLSIFSVRCHRSHLTPELFRGQLFQAIESRSKPAVCICDSVFSSPFPHNHERTASGSERGGGSSPQLCIINHKYDQLSGGRHPNSVRSGPFVARGLVKNVAFESLKKNPHNVFRRKNLSEKKRRKENKRGRTAPRQLL